MEFIPDNQVIPPLEEPVYLPLDTCVAQTRDGLLTAWFERHALCATVETLADDNTIVETLTDDISADISQMTSNFVEIVSRPHLQGNCIPFAAIR